MSRWLVGSSSSSTSGCATSAAARATRRDCPPLSADVGRSIHDGSSSPSTIVRIRGSAAHSCSGPDPDHDVTDRPAGQDVVLGDQPHPAPATDR